MYTQNEKLIPVYIEDEMKNSYITYAMSVIVGRALPDVKDGLKPVHRRILYAMRELGLEHNKSYKKSARVVGEVLGKFHPHGDMAVYDALVRMVQDFSLRYPLIDGQGNFGCFSKDTKIRLTDGRALNFGQLIKEAKKGKRNFTFTFNHITQKIEIAEIKKPRLTRKGAKIVKVILDNGEEIRCTLDHPFMLRDGTYKNAKDLKPQDSLMPLYTKLYSGKDDRNLKGYETVYQPMQNKWEFTHHLSDAWNLTSGIYKKCTGKIRHHIDFNKVNNNPNNIKRIQWGDHWSFHRDIPRWRHKYDAEYVKKLAKGRERFWANPKNRRNASMVRSEWNKKRWQDPVYRKEMAKVLKKAWKDPEYRQRMIELSSRNLKNRWKRKDFRDLLSKLKSKELKKRWQDEQYRDFIAEMTRRTSLKIWSDPKHRRRMSKLSKERWQERSYRKGQINRIKRLWKDPSFRAKYPPGHFSKIAKELWKNPSTREFHKRKAILQWQDEKFANRVTECIKKNNRLRLRRNPGLMKELTEKAKVSLKAKWQDPLYKEKVVKSKILGFVGSLLKTKKTVTPEIYEKMRTNNGLPNIQNALNYFSDFQEIIDQARAKHNHKVKAIKFLTKREDVYDLTIEGTHNFALASGVFVHNSVDGDAAAAMRYCVSGDSLIVTENGLERIAAIPHDSRASFKALSLNNKINHVSKWFDSGTHPTRTIKTYRGFNLCGSLNHPILTWQKGEGGRPQFKWKILGKIKKGDYAVISRSTLLFPAEDPSLISYHPQQKGTRKYHKLPEVMNPDLAFILGAIVSEGNIGKYQIGFCNNDGAFIEKFKASFKATFPDCRLHEFVRKPVGYTRKNYTSLEIHSRHVLEFLNNIGLRPGRAKNRVVPEIIFGSSKQSIASFIRGYAEGDASVYMSSSLKNIEISFISVSEKLMQELQILLLRFGIDSSYRWQRTKSIFKLFIHGQINLSLFKDEIDFFTQRKRKRLEEICERNKNGWVMSKTDFIPYISDYIRSNGYAEHKEWLERHNIDRYTKIDKHWKALQGIFNKEDERLYRMLMCNKYIFDPIVSVENTEVRNVYSIKIDSACHSFVSNGFISHNTEARMASIADELLSDIDKDTVDFVPNFDESLEEPSILPARLPNLLVNGSSGIAVGMATNIPPHNLTEIVDAIVKTIAEPGISIKDLMKIVKGPDFPTGGIICGRDGIKEAHEKGRGLLKLHAKAGIETQKGGKESIVITEIPYQVNKSKLIENIAANVQDKKIEGISDIRDESDKEGMRIVIDLKRDQNAQITLNQLYKRTQMETTFGVIMLALVDNRPRLLNLKEVIELYIKHREDIVRRRTQFELEKAEKRAHILEGLKIAIEHLNKIIKTIRESKDPKIAKAALMKNFDLSEAQSQAILEMQLQRLTALERNKIEKEYLELIKKIELYRSILKSEKKISEIVKDEALELKKKYGDERRTEIVAKAEEIEIEDLIKEEDMVITVSHTGYIKRLPIAAYRRQRRGGTGVTGIDMKEEDFVEHLFVASTHEYIVVFTNTGRVYWLKVYEIPQASRAARGKAIVNLLNLGSGERVSACVRVKDFEEGKFLVMATQNGLIKKTDLMAYSNPRKGGIIGITIEKEDELIDVKWTDGRQEILLATNQGKAIRFSESNVRDMGRGARGVKGISVGKKDRVIAMDIVREDSAILTVTSQGFAKRTPIKEYRKQSRGGKGIKNVNVTKKNGEAVGLKTVTDKDEVMVITEKGMIVRCAVKDIRTTGRATQGVRIIKLDKGDCVSTVASVVPVAEE